MLRILMIEDSKLDEELILRQIKRGGYSFAFKRVETKTAMQESLDSQEWDVVIADYSLPQFTAEGALKTLKENNLDLPFILVSGVVGEESAVKMMKAGADDFILKDKLERLCPAIEREIGEFHNRRERQKSEMALTIQFQVMHILSESKTIQSAIAKILPVMVEGLGWDVGSFWIIDEENNVLKNSDLWCRPDVNVPAFIQETKSATFAIGKGLPGIIWEKKRPQFFEDLKGTPDNSRLLAAAKNGFHGAYGFPVIVAEKVIGIIDFFSRKFLPPNDSQLQAMATVGGQIGQFINRVIAEEGLRKAIEWRDEFLSIASHELKTPMTSLNLQLEMTKKFLLTGADPASLPKGRLEKLLNDSSMQLSRMNKMVGELLDITKIQTGKIDLNLEKFDLKELSEEVIDRLQHLFEQNKTKIEVALENDLWINGDRFRLDQVIVNLISNSIKYGDGLPIRISASRSDDHVVLSIQDQGIGIPKEKLGKIFERFERVSTSTKVAGLGLGLYISRQIVEAHQGVIRVESELGKGSTFTVELPSI